MRIDSHQHFWQYDPARDGWIDEEMPVLKRDYLPADLLQELDANGIDAVVAVQAHQSEQETLFLLDLARRYPVIPPVWLDGWTCVLRMFVSGSEYFSRFEVLRGFRHLAQSEPDDRFLDSRRFRERHRVPEVVPFHFRSARPPQATSCSGGTGRKLSGSTLCA